MTGYQDELQTKEKQDFASLLCQNPANTRQFVVLVIKHVEMLNVMKNGFLLYKSFPILNGILASESFYIPVLRSSRHTHTQM